MMGKRLERLKKEDGSAQVIEMTLIFPFVLSVLAFLIYMGNYYMQSILIYNYAQQTAVATGRFLAYPGYDLLYGPDIITTKTDFDWAESVCPEDGTIDKIMQLHKPYRYWDPTLLELSMKSDLETSLNRLIASASLLTTSSLDCDIQAQNNMISQDISVHVVKTIHTPPLLQAIGLDNIIDIDITTVAIVGDPAEFVRNTDIVFDLVEYVFDTLKLSNCKTINENIAIYKQKFTDAKAKLGLK